MLLQPISKIVREAQDQNVTCVNGKVGQLRTDRVKVVVGGVGVYGDGVATGIGTEHRITAVLNPHLATP